MTQRISQRERDEIQIWTLKKNVTSDFSFFFTDSQIQYLAKPKKHIKSCLNKIRNLNKCVAVIVYWQRLQISG